MELSEPWIMGIINLTPDSFFDGGQLTTDEEILDKAAAHLSHGAKILDLGAYSSRPQAEDISVDEEINRLIHPLKLIRQKFPEVYLSVDTFRADVAQTAIDEGADMINDISGGFADENMLKTIAENSVPYIMMHMRGTPQNMQSLTQYEDLLLEIVTYFENQIDRFHEAGHNDIIIDPGIGFAKTIGQNYEILKNLDYFNVLKHPLLIGLSRKSFIYKTLGNNPGDSLNGTTVLHTAALLKGASILRVHDVKEAKEVVELIKKFNL